MYYNAVLDFCQVLFDRRVKDLFSHCPVAGVHHLHGEQVGQCLFLLVGQALDLFDHFTDALSSEEVRVGDGIQHGSSLDFSEDPNLDSEDDYNHCHGYNNLKVCHSVLLVAIVYYNAASSSCQVVLEPLRTLFLKDSFLGPVAFQQLQHLRICNECTVLHLNSGTTLAVAHIVDRTADHQLQRQFDALHTDLLGLCVQGLVGIVAHTTVLQGKELVRCFFSV